MPKFPTNVMTTQKTGGGNVSVPDSPYHLPDKDRDNSCRSRERNQQNHQIQKAKQRMTPQSLESHKLRPHQKEVTRGFLTMPLRNCAIT